MSLTLAPRHQVAGVVTVPGSKSLANRALLLAALAHGTSEIRNLPISDDVSYLLRALRTLGVTYDQNKAQKHCQIVGCGGQFPATGSGKALFLGNAGTALRPLTAILSLDNRHTPAVNWVITGEPRMQVRPIAPLVEALQQGGAVIKYCATPGYPPLQLQGGFRGGRIRITGHQSQSPKRRIKNQPEVSRGCFYHKIRSKIEDSLTSTFTTISICSHCLSLAFNQYYKHAHNHTHISTITKKHNNNLQTYRYNANLIRSTLKLILAELTFVWLNAASLPNNCSLLSTTYYGSISEYLPTRLARHIPISINHNAYSVIATAHRHLHKRLSLPTIPTLLIITAMQKNNG